jgi:dolichol-phosphate mannosyltransferase
MRRFGDHSAVPGSTDFRLLDGRVCAAMRRISERDRLFRGLVDWLGFTRVTIEFDAPARHSGVPSYTLPKLWNMAVHAFVSHTQFPLRFVLYSGLLTVLLATVGLTWMQFAESLISAQWHYTPMAKALVFNTGLVGITQISLGIVGLYVAKIHHEVAGRPLYAVRSITRGQKS